MNNARTGVLAAGGVFENTPCPDFYFRHHGNIAVLVPLTLDGHAWVTVNLPADTMHWAGGVVIEARMVPDIIEGIRFDGLVLGGEA